MVFLAAHRNDTNILGIRLRNPFLTKYRKYHSSVRQNIRCMGFGKDPHDAGKYCSESF